ncbi:MAG: hypothetical protein PVJ05_11670 [Candidatus Thorarchaeota archaeon]|jgi:hypothetical protein
MIIDKSSTELTDLKTRFYQVVSEDKVSSLSMICDITGTDEEMARSILDELVDEGTLEGSFTSDGQRFFLSDVKVSSAPLAPTRDEGYVIEKADTRQGKLVLVSGIVMMIGGFIVRGLTALSTMMENIGVALIMLGLVVLIAGWLMITRADPPSNLKR